MKKGKVNISSIFIFFSVIIPLLVGCQSEDNLDSLKLNTSGTELKLTFVIPATKVATRATTQGYEAGTNYENEINLSAYDYRLYFFTYEKEDESGGKLIAEFFPTSVISSTIDDETIYTVTGSVPDELLEESNFRAVVLANWGHNYPDVTVGTTTIDDLTEGTYSTFIASDKFTLDANNLIPFYGVQQYSGITFKENQTTSLEKEVSLLRALAKVEVVLKDDDLSFSEVILHNYNAKGYSAPQGIYTAEDYHTGTWDDDYVQTLHLVGDANYNADTGDGISFNKTQERVVDSTTGEVTQYETWVLYIPEYDNTTVADDAAYIDVWFDYQTDDDEPYSIYFKEYDDEDGTLKENAKTWDIYRNNLYRFNVSFGEYELKVNVQDWENVFENDFTFGDLSHVIFKDTESTDGEGYFWVDGVMFYSQVDEDNYNEGDELTAYIKQYKIDESQPSYTIPSEIYYLGYTYTITGIGDYCFQADTWLSTIVIPSSITYIGSDAFYGDSNLITLVVQCSEPPTCESNAFDGDDVDEILLIVPTGSYDKYYNDDVWGQFGTIQERSM